MYHAWKAVTISKPQKLRLNRSAKPKDLSNVEGQFSNICRSSFETTSKMSALAKTSPHTASHDLHKNRKNQILEQLILSIFDTSTKTHLRISS